MRIFTYGQQCILAGRVWVGNDDDDPEENGDLDLWGEGTREELIAEARRELTVYDSVRDQIISNGAGRTESWSFSVCQRTRTLMMRSQNEKRSDETYDDLPAYRSRRTAARRGVRAAGVSSGDHPPCCRARVEASVEVNAM